MKKISDKEDSILNPAPVKAIPKKEEPIISPPLINAPLVSLSPSKQKQNDTTKVPSPATIIDGQIGDTNPAPQPSPAQELHDLHLKAISIPLSQIAAQSNSNELANEQVLEIFKDLGNVFGVPTVAANVATMLLFLKGAANSKAPGTMSVEIFDDNGRPVTITKYDLMVCYRKVTGNTFLRRLADTLCVQIGSYAERHGLSGDLAVSLNNGLLAKGEPCLTSKERAWASSFCQNAPRLDERSSIRLSQLLAADFIRRFSSPKNQINNKGSKDQPVRGQTPGQRKSAPKGPKGPGMGKNSNKGRTRK